MMILSWNRRGMVSRFKANLIRDIIIMGKPFILLVEETKLEVEEAVKISNYQ
jgi:hypothetical protein